jgi:hypothetical protein
MKKENKIEEITAKERAEILYNKYSKTVSWRFKAKWLVSPTITKIICWYNYTRYIR